MSLGKIPVRVLIWAIAGAALGAFVNSKAAVIAPEEVLAGGAIGAIVGAIFGQLFQTLARSKKSRKRRAE